jgi:hypothetical protein
MKIHFERTGGFAGMVSSTTVDTSSLPSDEARKVEDLVQQANIPSNSPATENLPQRGAADYFTYQITIESEEGTKDTVECTDVAMSPSIKPLLDYLMKQLRR